MKRSSLVALFTFLAIWSTPAWGLRPTVVDGADLFSPKAIDQANDAIKKIKQQFGKDMMIETYPAIPADQQAEFKKKGKEAFYAEWVESRAKALGADGVLILITRDPGRFQVAVDPQTRKTHFSAQDQEELRTELTQAFREKKFDEGLLAAVELVRARLERHAPPATNPTNGPATKPVG